MRFGKILRQSIYPPWKDQYIDYAKLKAMLREDKSEDDDEPWTEIDENRFCDEIFNVQLEKVARFQEETVDQLRRRTDEAFEKLKTLAPAEAGGPRSDITTQRLRELEGELDAITNEITHLKKYSSVNYTGFLKIVKKHDRKRGDSYKIRPMMQLSLARRPFNSEQAYSPLLNKLSLTFYAVRQHLDADGSGAGEMAPPDVDSTPEMHNGERYTAHKFWVHPDNLLEVKTVILRRLPALVYSQHQPAREADGGEEDPSLTSLYFDSPSFGLYANKVERQAEAASLRLRWYGPLRAKPELFLEQKILHESSLSEERKLTLKEKYVGPFLSGDYDMGKTLQKMERQGRSAEEVAAVRTTAETIQRFVREHRLEPVLRANYVRAAFQKPADDRVRISIDTDLAFVREDSLDRDRPCRDPHVWHRSDVDNSPGNAARPAFQNVNQREVSRFPYAVLEIKLKEESSHRRRAPHWVEDLMASHLVHPAPRFSKFVHGVASLFDDYVNSLPFWLSDLETDIRKDPQVAFDEEEHRRAERAKDELVVGSFLGTKISASPFKPSKSSPVGKSYLAERDKAEAAAGGMSGPQQHALPQGRLGDAGQSDGQGGDEPRDYGTMASLFPVLASSLSRYAKAKRARKSAAAETLESLALPPGVAEPAEWIKNAGPLRIEPKVWLANERTFLKWQHISVLLGGLSVGLYTAASAGSGRDRTLAAAMGIVYLAVAVFAGLWGYAMMRRRRDMIIARSGRNFDNVFGPLVISAMLMTALVLNFGFAYRDAVERMKHHEINATYSYTGADVVG